MLPRFKYLSEKLYTPKRLDRDGRLDARDGSKDSSARTNPLAGELFTAIQTGVIENYIKQDGISTSGDAGGFFAGAKNFTLNHPTFTDNSQTTNYFMIGFPVLLTLKDAGTPAAALDSAARHPPPKCHPGSRRTINGRLEKWLLDLYRQRKMTWLYGPAGVGKSAVAQTFGELAEKRGCLGAAFFSAFDDLPTDSLRIIPTLAYQLAIRNANYKQVITQQLAGDPSILDAALPVQFQKLIIEPFSLLTPPATQRTASTQPYVVILDGLDECEDENAQCELIELINNAAQRNDLPLIWLLCSRPESHIKYTFSQLEFIRSCDREELVIDDETRADVEQFLRDSFKDIQKRYQFVISVEFGTVWPSEESFDKISKAVSGYFVFASTVTRVVGDKTVGDPESQLSVLLKMLQGLDDIGLSNPLESLDIFYSRILSRVPEPVLPVATQILGVCARGGPSDGHDTFSAEQLRLFLQIEKAVFYRSLDKLHSVVRIPLPEDIEKKGLSFFHKSFGDYLGKERRSGRFFTSDVRVKILLGTSSLYWYNHIIIYEHPNLVGAEEHGRSKAALRRWFPGIELGAFTDLASALRQYYFEAMAVATEADIDFFDALCDFNFGLITKLIDQSLIYVLLARVHVWDWSRTSAGEHFIRTKVVNKTVDLQLFYHLSILTSGTRIPPLNISEPVVYHRGRPLPWNGLKPGTMGFVIIGRGLKSCLVCCFQQSSNFRERLILNPFVPPTTYEISEFQRWVKEKEKLALDNTATKWV